MAEPHFTPVLGTFIERCAALDERAGHEGDQFSQLHPALISDFRNAISSLSSEPTTKEPKTLSAIRCRLIDKRHHIAGLKVSGRGWPERGLGYECQCPGPATGWPIREFPHGSEAIKST